MHNKMPPSILLMIQLDLLRLIEPNSENIMTLTSQISFFLQAHSHLALNTKRQFQYGKNPMNLLRQSFSENILTRTIFGQDQ